MAETPFINCHSTADGKKSSLAREVTAMLDPYLAF